MPNPFDQFDQPATAGGNPFDQFAPAPAAQPETPGFVGALTRGFKRSLPETKGLLAGAGAAVAGAVGADGVRDKLLRTYQDIQQQEVAPLANQSGFIDSVTGDGSLREWAGDTLGNFAGQAVQSLAAGAAGAVVGSAVPGAGTVAGGVGGLVARTAAKDMVESAVGRMVANGVAKDAAEKLVLRRMGGAALATTGLNVGQEVGIGYTGRAEDAAAAGEDLTRTDALRAIGYGIPAGLLDTATEAFTAGKLMRGASNSPNRLTRMAAGAATGAVTEGGTEGAQAVLERAGAAQALTGPDAYKDYIENVAAGALGGSVPGAAGGIRTPDALKQQVTAPAPGGAAASATPPATIPPPPAGPLTRAAATLATTPTGAVPATTTPAPGDTAAPPAPEPDAPPATQPAATQGFEPTDLYKLAMDAAVKRGITSINGLQKELDIPREQARSLINALETNSVLSKPDERKRRRLLIDPITGALIDEAATKADRKQARKQADLELRIAAGLAPARPEPSGPVSAAAASAVDTGAADIVQMQQAAQQIEGQQPTAADQQRAQREQLQQAKLDRQAQALDAQTYDENDLRALMEADLDAGKTIDSARMMRLARQVGVKPRAVDTLRRTILSERANGSRPAITDQPIDAEFTDVTEQDAATSALPASTVDPKTAARLFPFPSEESARASAEKLTQRKGVPYTVVPHPREPGKWVAAPQPKAPLALPAPAPTAEQAAPVEGKPIDAKWTAFAPESGTLGVPRAQMPQIRAEHRGALVNYLNARGIGHDSEQVPAESLKPTQAEFAPAKVQKAAGGGTDRSILVSQDGHVLDGHHQWMAARNAGLPVNIIRLQAPIQELLQAAKEFPSSTVATGAAGTATGAATAPGTATKEQSNEPDGQEGQQGQGRRREGQREALLSPGATVKQSSTVASPERDKALKRIERGTAYFGTRAKSDEFIANAGLGDSHEAVQVKAGRFDVRAKQAADVSTEPQNANTTAEGKPTDAASAMVRQLADAEQRPGVKRSLTALADAMAAKDEKTVSAWVAENPDNTTLRKAFEDATGVKLPRTIKGGREAVSAWAAGKVDAAPQQAQNVEQSAAPAPDRTLEGGVNGAPDQPGAQALDQAPAQEGGGTPAAGSAGVDPAGGSAAGVRSDSGAAAVRVPPVRGGGSRKERVPDSESGATGGRRRGSGRTARDGAGIPQDDAGVTAAPTPETAQPPNIPAINFKITDDAGLGKGGEVAKFKDNVEAIRTLKRIESERRRATPDEQRALARWVGWGGLASAFPNPETGEFKDGWQQRGNELRDLLTPSEYRAARRSTRNAHFTSEVVVNFMWDAVRRLGYRNGLALESSMGSGNFLGLMPDDLSARFIGVEYDSITARIAGALYPQATVLHSGFQDVPLPDGTFDLNIGNPPFGSESLRFQFKPELRGLSIHNQFFLASLDALKEGGLQVQVVSSFLMDAQDKGARQMLANKADLIAAFRLPDTAFKENARTEVVTDILILRKRGYPLPRDKDNKGKELPPDYPDWVNTTTVPDPLGGDPIPVNTYFKAHPDHIIGTMDRSGKMRAAGMMNVHLDDPSSLGTRLQALLSKVPQNVVNAAADVAERTEQAYKLLGEAMRIAVAREEPGHMAISADGQLTRVIEREHGDGTILQRQSITANSPWSPQLFVDAQGRWYKVEVQTDVEGKPVKMTDASGAPTRLNAYTRTAYATEADVPATLRLGKLGFERMTQLVRIRDLLKNQLVLETEDALPAMMEGNRAKLAAAYKSYVDEHGPINRRANAALVSNMPDGGLLLALESSYEPERTAEQAKRSGLPKQSEIARPAAILSERVVPKYDPPTKAETPADALAITLAERGVVDIEHIAKLLGQTPEQAAAALTAGEKPLIFKDPELNTYETADAYLSGQVVRKLMAARAAGLAQNVVALESVQPERWGAENINAQLGAAWIPAPMYAEFAEHLLGGKATVHFSAPTNTFTLTTRNEDRNRAEIWRAFDENGIPTLSGSDILSRLLNSQTPTVMRKDGEGKPYVDKKATSLAILKGREIVSEFSDWIFKDGGRREQLVDLFNQKFNTRVSRQYDGSHLKLPGKVPDAMIQMRRHQKNAIWRGISSKFLLIDHVVGAGKTFTAIARAMERRRMGLARKPAIVVPNHLVEQWQADIYRLYPAAKVLAATKQDFEKKNRRRLLSRVATGDYDIVILPHSSFGFVGVSPETELRYLEEDLQLAIQAVADAQEQAEEDGEAGWRKPLGVKEAERLVASIENRMAKLREGARDRLLTFEQLGIDDLTIDEAHEFKNLFYSSRLTKVRGMGDKVGSRKAADLYNKVRVVRDSNGAVVFMTGTPVSNSVVELYTMMRYLAAPELKELEMEHFDAWRSQFVEATPAFEPSESGRLQEVTRLGRSWSNMRSLMDLYYSFTDAVTIDDIKQWYAEDNQGKAFPVPRVKGGDRQLRSVQPTPAQELILQEVLAGFDGLEGITDVQERNATRLRLMDRARKLSLDVRAVDPRVQSKEEGGKLEQLSAEVKRIYDKWTPDRGTQLVFLDRSVPKAKGDDKIIKEYDAIVARRDKALRDDDEVGFQEANEALERYDADEIRELRNAQAGGWNAYQQIKDNLVALGIPPAEIRFVQEASTDEQKQALFDAVNGGKVRVLIGSTPRMGAGTNVQKRLVALHHADVTWKPSDIEQREGRIIRQGNELLAKYGENFEVEILAYATERTVDAKMWGLNATKLRAINGLRKYTGDFTMEVEDSESVSMAEMAAIASGNPLLLERVTLESEITNLELQEKSHRRKRYGVEDALRRAQEIVANHPEQIARARELVSVMAGKLKQLLDSASKRSVAVEGKAYTDARSAMKAALDAVQFQQQGNDKARYAITIDGARVTSKDAIEAAIGSAIGDHEPFEATIGGTAYTQRTAAGRAAADLIDLKKPVDNGKLGSMMGMDLMYAVRPIDLVNVNVEVWLEDAGQTVASVDLNKYSILFSLSTSKMRDVLGMLATDVANAASTKRVTRLEDQLAQARQDIPELEQRRGEQFPKAQEITDKRNRLKEVVQLLTGPGAAPEKASFAKSGEVPDAQRHVLAAWQKLARTDGLFQIKTSSAKDFTGIVRDVAPDITVVSDDGDSVTLEVQPQKTPAGEVARDRNVTLVFLRMFGSIERGRLVGYTEDGTEAYAKDVQSRADIERELGNDVASRLLDQPAPMRAVEGVAVHPLGTPKAVTMTVLDGELAMDASQLRSGVHRGSALYAVALSYARNNGVVFVPDPAGVSDDAMIRRAEHMLSSALKTGTTRHMRPHPDQNIAWTEGDDQANVLALLKASADNVLRNVPHIENVDYDWDNARFIDSETNQPVSTADFERAARSADARAARAGASTLRRAVVHRSMARRAGTPAWRGLVTRLLQLGRTGLRGSGLEGLAYGRGATGARGMTVEALNSVLAPALKQLAADRRLDVQVVATHADLPQSIRDQADFDDTVQAAFQGRTAYFVASAIRDRAQARRLFAHEVVGHYGIEGLLGPTLFAELKRQILSLRARGKWPQVFSEVSRRYERNADGTFRPLDDDTFAAEAIAVFAERNIQTSLLQRAMAAVRAFLRRLFPDMEISQGELRQLLWEAGQRLEGRPYRPSAERVLGAGRAASMRQAVERFSFSHSDQRAPFYSALLRSVEEAKGAPKLANGQAWKQWFDGAQRRGEFKQAERDWIDVDAWLDQQQRPVPREALTEYVRANQVQVREVLLAGSGQDVAGQSAYDQFLREMTAKYGNDWEFEATEDELAKRELLLSRATTPPAKFERYQLPGGQDYRELLLTMPVQKPLSDSELLIQAESAAGAAGWDWGTMSEDARRRTLNAVSFKAKKASVDFYSSHFHEPNILAHVRFNERLDADGKRVLFVEEVQSDWHQAGRKKGYRKNLEQVTNFADWARSRGIDDAQMNELWRAQSGPLWDQWEQFLTESVANTQKPPEAPLKKEWPLTVMKRMIRWAAENGFDRLAWTTGEQQADRYDLSKQVAAIGYRANSDGTFTLSTWPLKTSHRTNWAILAAGISRAALPNYVGKEIAKRITDGEGRKEGGLMVLDGEDLRVGGAGMRAFYDTMLPAELDKYVKKFGSKVSTTTIAQNREGGTRVDDGAGGMISIAGKLKTSSQPSIDITPSMRDAALQGQPLFAKSDTLTRLQELINPGDRSLLDRIKDRLQDWRPAALGALQLRHLGELAEDSLPPVAQYADVVQRMATMRNELQERGHGIVEAGMKYQGANRQESQRLFRMLHDATLAGVDPAEAHQPLRMLASDYRTNVEVTEKSVREFVRTMRGQARLNPGSASTYVNRAKEARQLLQQERKRAQSHRQMAPAFAELSPEAKALWVQMRDAYRAQSAEYEQALISRIESMDFDRKEAHIDRMRLKFEAARVPFYVPLARWGEYWVSGTAPDGTREFYMQERASDQRRVRAELESRGYTNIGAGVKIDTARAQDGATAGFMAEMDKMLQAANAPEKVRDEAFQLYLRTLPDLSIRKNFIHRQGTPGYSQDAIRALAGHIFHGSFQIARMRYSHELDALRREAEQIARNMATMADPGANAAGAVVNELKKRHEWVLNPTDNALVNKISSVGFVYYLGLTPAAALVNLLQTPMVALPVLAARHDAGKAARELWRAMRQSLGTYGHMERNLEGEELAAHQEFARRGVFDKTQAHNLAGVAESDTHAYSPQWHKVMTVISHVFHKAEVVNREATAMAAYRLARAAGAGHYEAIQQADRDVHESQFDYSNANRARWMQSGAAKVLLMFRQYSLAVTWLIGRAFYQAIKGADPETRNMARRKLTGILGMTALFSGTLGLPILGSVGGILNALAAAFGDDDEPWDWETELRAFLREMLGDTGAEAILRGPVQAATGLAIAQRVGMSDLWFREPDRELEGRAWANYLFEQAAGPMGGLVTNFFRGQQLMADGHVWRGVETMMPKALKDAMKSVRYVTDGVNNLRGDPIVEDLNVFESLAQISGFSPASVANAYDYQRDIKGYEQYILDRRRALMDAFALAYRLGDTEGRDAVVAKMREFSAAYPALAITADGIRRSLMSRARYSQQADAGIIVDRRLRAGLEDRLGAG